MKNNEEKVTERMLRLLKSQNQDDVVLGLNLLPDEIKQKIRSFHVQSIYRIPLNLVGFRLIANFIFCSLVIISFDICMLFFTHSIH